MLFLPFTKEENEQLQVDETWHDTHNKHLTLITENMKKYNKIYEMTTTKNQSSNISNKSTASTSNSFFPPEQYDIALDIPTKPKKHNRKSPFKKHTYF